MLQEFKEFINRGNVVMIAVGLVLALYFQAIVDALLQGVVLPVIAAIFGEPNFAMIGFHLGDAFISIGLVINAIISFILVSAVLFLVVKAYNRIAPEKPAPDAGPSEVALLAEIRDILANRKV